MGKLHSLVITMMIFLCSPLIAQAEEEEAAEPEIQYVPLKPAFVTNYMAHKLRYFKADVTVKVRGAATAEAIDRHQPYIRHNLVMLFSAQDQNSLNSKEGKQKLQEDALNEVVSVLNEENEPTDVEGILFTSFIVE
ncbi:MAG: flagellar basal body-associated FliL family protein [Pseudomonadales bacterium]|nr:flagellar basal body-associated FliL family protein [Pseudomonadales bacterium]